MKRIFLICVIFSLISCTNEKIIKDYNNRKTILGTSQTVEYIQFDGHEYVRYIIGHSGSLTHSPNCSCLKQYKKENNEF